MTCLCLFHWICIDPDDWKAFSQYFNKNDKNLANLIFVEFPKIKPSKIQIEAMT